MGTLFVVATPIGNLNDLSPRAIATLENSDLILVEDTRQTIKLLNHFNIKTKMISYHKFNETKRTKEIIPFSPLSCCWISLRKALRTIRMKNE